MQQVLVSFMLQFNLNIIHVAKNQDSGTERPKLISDMKMGYAEISFCITFSLYYLIPRGLSQMFVTIFLLARSGNFQVIILRDGPAFTL